MGARGIPDEFHWLRDCSLNAEHAVNIKRDELVSGLAQLGIVDFFEDQPEFFSWKAELQIEYDGVMHGTVMARPSVREIEQAVLRDHPELFPSAAEISRFVAHVLGRDTV